MAGLDLAVGCGIEPVERTSGNHETIKLFKAIDSCWQIAEVSAHLQSVRRRTDRLQQDVSLLIEEGPACASRRLSFAASDASTTSDQPHLALSQSLDPRTDGGQRASA